MNINTSVSAVPPAFSEEGWHLARCVAFYELGTVYNGRKNQKQVRITWEMPYDQRPYDANDPSILRPKLISRDYASALYGESHLLKHLQQWLGIDVINEVAERQQRGLNFDPYLIIEEPCQIKIAHKQNGNSKKWFEDVIDVYAIQKKETLEAMPARFNDTKVLQFTDWNKTVFDELPDFLKNKIIGSPEYERMMQQREGITLNRNTERPLY